MTSYKRLSLLTALILTSACFKPTQKNSDQTKGADAASFYLEEITGDAQIISTGAWSLPTEKKYNFKVCAKDIHSQEAIRGHQFIITDGTKTIDKKRSGSDGCLNWSENIKYNYLANPKFVPLTRFIKADGIHTGQKKVNLAINPWQERANSAVNKEVVDLSFKSILQTQMATESENLLSISPNSRLWVDGMIFNISNLGGPATNRNAILKLDMVPRLLVSDINNDVSSLTLTRAKFKVEAHLVAIVGQGATKKKFLIGNAKMDKSIQMVGERFRVDVPMEQLWKSTMGQLELAVRLIPDEENSPPGIESFEGVFLIGSYKTMSAFVGITPQTNSLEKATKFKLDDYLKSLTSPDAPEAHTSGIYPLQPFWFSLFDFPFAEVSVVEETPTTRTIKILIQTTVSNPLDNTDTIANTEFTVRKIDGQEIHTQTNQNGILSWRDTITYKTMSPPHYLQKTVEISHTTGFKQTFSFKINPWAKFGYALGVDDRRFDALSKIQEVEKAAPLLRPQMYMGKYVFAINKNTEYVISKDFFTVTPYKSFVINLAPYLLTYSNPLDGIESSVSMRDGYYLLKVGLESNIFGRKYISVTKKLVILRNGQINEPIRMRINDIRQMKIRNLVYVEIRPVDYSKLTFIGGVTKGNVPKIYRKNLPTDLDELIEKDSGLEPRTFMGVFNPGVNKGEGPLRPTDDLDEMFNDMSSVANEDDDLDQSHSEESIKAPTYKVFDELIPVDDPNMNFKNYPRFQTLMQDPKFKENLKIGNANKVNEFLLRMRNEGYQPLTITDLEIEKKKLNQQYKEDTQKRATLDEFVQFANSEYIALNNEAEIYKNNPKLKSNNFVLSKQNADKTFLAKLNSANSILGTLNPFYPDSRPFTKKYSVSLEDLQNLLPQIKGTNVERIVALPTLLATRLCNFWFNEFYGYNAFGSSQNALFSACVNDIKAGGNNLNTKDRVFVLDQKLRVFSLPVYKFLKGFSFRVGTGSGFRVSYGYGAGESSSLSMAWSFAPVGALFPYQAIHFLSNLAAGFGSTFHSESQGFDAGYGKSADVDAKTTLSAEEAKFLLGIDQFERCSILKLNPAYISKQNLLSLLQIKATPAQKSKLLTRGIMICNGKTEATPIVVPESVFYFSPDPGASSLLDSTDIKNYAWAITMRSRADFTAFIDAIRANGVKLEEQSMIKRDLKNMLNKYLENDVDQDPVGHVLPSVQDVQKPAAGVVTTYPGVYTVP